MQVSSFKEKAKLIISKEVQSQVMYLHNKIGNIEWSGLLFYSIVSGEIGDPKNLVLKTEKIYLMDIGNATYTEFTPDETIVDFYEKYPEAMNQKWGLIHTHHNMDTFFSGQDMDELKSNSGSHNFYLSLIVNHRSVFNAKIGVVAEVEKQTTSKYVFGHGLAFKGWLDGLIKKEEKDKCLMTIDCEIEFEQAEFEVDRYEAIRLEKMKSKATTYPTFAGMHYSPDLFSEENVNNKKPNIKHLGFDIYIPKTKNELQGFLSDFWSMRANNKLNLRDCLEEVNEEFEKDKEQFTALYWEGLDYAFQETFHKHFGNYLAPLHEDRFFKQCIWVMDDFRRIGFPLHDKMIEYLDSKISGNDEEEEEEEDTTKKDSKKTHKLGANVDFDKEVSNAIKKFKNKKK